MFMPRRFWIEGTITIGLAVVLLVFSASAWAAGDVEITKPRTLELVVDKSFVLPIPEPVRASDEVRVTIAAPEIADFIFIPKMTRGIRPKYIYIKGKKPGMTNLTLWIGEELVAVYDVQVTYGVLRLKQNLHEILPDEKDIRVFATHDSVVLSGVVSSAENLSEVVALARATTTEDKLVNLLQVAGVHQVMLEVTIAEISRSVAKTLGVNFNWINDRGEFFIGTIGAISSLRESDINAGGGGDTGGIFGMRGPVGANTASSNAAFRWNASYGQVTGIIDYLKGNGLIKILAEPNLIALSGQTASFLAGGEFPIPEVDRFGNTGVTYRTFGIELAFTPTVLNQDKISIKVLPAVSELDYSISTSISGALVPGLTTRRASTIVELGDGQSFAIAGLLKDTTREAVSKYPVLGDLPILGALFKSQTFQRQETELIILVTPHLVKPLNAADQSLPTDYYIEPDDAEFYFWGILGKSHENVPSEMGGLDGEFGHIFTK
jgi:pilus assembly protein CpaC